MIENPYSTYCRPAERGGGYCVHGDGISNGYYATMYPSNYNSFNAEDDAKRAALLMRDAYEAGRLSAQREIRKAIGL